LLFKFVLGIALSLAMAVFAKTAAAAEWQAQPLTPSESSARGEVAEAASLIAAPSAPRVSIAAGGTFGYLPLDAFGVAPTPVGDEQILNFTVPPARKSVG
jgi:hypothetical protein